jgi:hypothetical protein
MKKPLIAFVVALVLSCACFAQVTRQSVPHLGRLAADPNCTFKGATYYNTATDHYRKCTATGTPGTWTDMDAGGGGSSAITVGTTTSDGTANVLLKTSSTGKVNNAPGLVANGTGVTLAVTPPTSTDVAVQAMVTYSSGGNAFEARRTSDNGLLFQVDSIGAGLFAIGNHVRVNANGVSFEDGANMWVRNGSGGQIAWDSNTNGAAGTLDSGIGRSGAGVLKITNGTTGMGSLIGGTFTASDPTTPSFTTSAGTTNTGFMLINGKTSGGLKLTSADAAAQTVTVNLAAQTTGAATATIPDLGGASVTLPVLQYASNTADFTLAAASGVQSPFAAANDVFTVAANTTYFCDGDIFLTTGATTHTTAFGFGGTATFTSINYWAELWSNTDGTISTTAPSYLRVAAATSTVLNATSTATGTVIRIRGMIRTSAAGTLIPQINFSANPTGTNLALKNSFFRCVPAGANTNAATGPWN